MKKILFFVIVFLSVLTFSVYLIISDVSDHFDKQEEIKEKEEIINEESPLVKVIEENVSCQYIDEYDVLSNVEITYSGSYETAYTDEQVGEDDNDHRITVTVTGDNLKEASASYTLHETKTEGKDLFIVGDSIVKGFGADNKSFADYIGEDYDFAEVYKSGNNDYRVSTYDDANKWLVTSVKKYADDKNYSFDYIIMEGWINDVFYDTPLGDYNDTDKNTFTGGLRMYLDEVTHRWPDARIGYLITSYPLNYSERGITWTKENYKVYHDRTVEILNEYNIEYLDLCEDKYMEMLKAGEKTYLPDYLHPNAEGHKMMAEVIFDWVEDLSKYEK